MDGRAEREEISAGGGGYIVYSRSLSTIDPRTLTIAGRNTSGCRRPGRHCLHQKDRELFDESYER